MQLLCTLNHLLCLLASSLILLATSMLVLSCTAEMSVSTVLWDFPAKRLLTASTFDFKTCPEEPRCVPQVLSNLRYATSVPRPKYSAANLELVQNRGSLLSKSEESGSFFLFLIITLTKQNVLQLLVVCMGIRLFRGPYFKKWLPLWHGGFVSASGVQDARFDP